MYDLHVHSYFSDGKMSPKKIAETAASLGLTGLALSDHDTMDGLDQMMHYGKKQGLDVLTAVEFGTSREKDGQMTEIHILGYGLDPENEKLNRTLDQLKEARNDRIRTIISILHDFGLDITEEEVFAKKKRGIIGRGQVADLLREKQYVQNAGEAFDRFLGAGKFAYVPKTILDYRQIIDLIHHAGGIAVCAHPKTMKNDAILDDLTASGLDGIEIINSKHQLRDVHRYIGYAAEHPELITTAGSDCHGRKRSNGELFMGRYGCNAHTVETMRKKAMEKGA